MKRREVHAVVLGIGLTAALAVLASAQAANPPRTNARTRLNAVIERLEQGKSAVGTFPGTSLADARALSESSNDFVMFDLQYGMFDVGRVQASMMGLLNRGALVQRGTLQALPTPLVRIPVGAHDAPEYPVKQLLDIGAYGIMFPDVESKADAERAVRSMRYPQRSGVSFDANSAARGPVDAFWYWGVKKEEYMKRADVWPLNADGELLTIVQIESAAGVQHRDEIMSVPGVGLVFIGPFDLSRSIGEAGPNTPKTEENVQMVLKTCLEKKVPCGYPVVEPTAERGRAQLAERQRQGFRIVTVNTSAR